MSYESMTMEEIFVVICVGAVIVGIALGCLAYWIFEKDNKEENE